MIGRVRVLCFVVTAAALAGCGDRPPVSNLCPVRGKVVANGKPVEKVSVRLHPVGFAIPDAAGATTGGKTDEIGAFYMNPGVPPGKYQVTIEKPKKAKAGAAPAVVPDRYADPAKSGLEVEIVPGANELPPFDVK